jgi:hypothetical protein
MAIIAMCCKAKFPAILVSTATVSMESSTPKRWTPAFLRETVGTVPLSATLPGADGKFRYEPGRMPDAQPLRAVQFFDDMADPAPEA